MGDRALAVTSGSASLKRTDLALSKNSATTGVLPIKSSSRTNSARPIIERTHQPVLYQNILAPS